MLAHQRIGRLRLDQHEDAFGNITHAFAAEGPLPELTLLAEGEIETRDAQGVVCHAVERFPPSLFLRETQLTSCDSAIGEFADATRQTAGPSPLDVVHALLSRLNDELEYDADPTHPASSAAEAFAAKRGICQDLAHLGAAPVRGMRYGGGGEKLAIDIHIDQAWR